MADEQPNTPSEQPAQTPDVSAAEPASTESQEQPSKSPSWWGKLFRRGGGAEADSESEEQAGEQAASRLTLTQEELDRRVQAETDRREARRAQQAAAEHKRKLRDEDPWQYAEEERKAERVAQGDGALQGFIAGLSREHDQVSIDPVLETLPPTERQRILKLEGAGAGLDGRKLVVTEAMKALEKHWRAEGAKDAEARLRRNPAFRKQVLAEGRGAAVDPDLLPAMGSSEADQTMSALLRKHYRMG